MEKNAVFNLCNSKEKELENGATIKVVFEVNNVAPQDMPEVFSKLADTVDITLDRMLFSNKPAKHRFS